MPYRLFRSLLLASLLLLAGHASAQLPADARAALDAARDYVAQAQREEIAPYPDAPLWRDALQQGERAARLAPDAAEPLRFLAETYSTTRWYVRAWASWQRYAQVAGSLDEAALSAAADVGTTLAYLRYQEGDVEQALAHYLEVTALAPDDPEAYIWLGRILLESGRPADAVPYWERAVELEPDNESAGYFLGLARDEVRFGIRGARSFYEGIRRYEAGDVSGALDAFQQAAAGNPDYQEAYVWLGRSALELERPQLAAEAWRRVIDLDPEDQRASYFLVLAQDQLRWGVAAVDAFRDGVARYEGGDLDGARASFVRASEANTEYPAAWAWRGRTALEREDYRAARDAYQRALELEPDNATYQYFLGQAERALGD